ncbi:Pro-resilin [Blattella germanica]|nr:Pro-resilin [Blattella germanica]
MVCAALLLASLLGVAMAQNYLPPSAGGNGGGRGNGGGGGGGYGAPAADDASEPANYEFSYEVQDAASGNDFGHKESRQGDVATGNYHVLLPDGRTQIVDYTADNDGYKPNVKYEGEASAGGGYPSGGPSSGYRY